MGRVWTLLGLLAVGTAAACMARETDEEVGGSRAAATENEFDRNAVLDDKSLRDVGAMTVEDVQSFLEETPYDGEASVLATYEENGKTAAAIIHEKATEHGINPLELLVRLQMDKGLISKKTAKGNDIKHAFACGCPNTSVCAKYEGFTNQADCAAGTLRRSMDRATTATGTVSGWARSRSKQTEDGLMVTPKNSATAALYTYTPYVGEAGGGRDGVGGVSLHYQVWTRFAEFTGYGLAAPQTPQNGEADAGTRRPDASADAGNAGEVEEEEEENEDPPPPSADAGSGDAGPPKKDDAKEGSDDDEILGQGNAPPTSNGPPPGGIGGKKKSEDLPMASEDELAGKKKKAASGCAMSPSSSSSSAALVAVAVAAVLVNARRRRARRTG